MNYTNLLYNLSYYYFKYIIKPSYMTFDYFIQFIKQNSHSSFIISSYNKLNNNYNGLFTGTPAFLGYILFKFLIFLKSNHVVLSLFDLANITN